MMMWNAKHYHKPHFSFDGWFVCYPTCCYPIIVYDPNKLLHHRSSKNADLFFFVGGGHILPSIHSRLVVSACLRRIRAQKYIAHVCEGFGDVGGSIVEAFFLYGRMSKSALVRDIVPLLEVEAVSLGKNGNYICC